MLLRSKLFLLSACLAPTLLVTACGNTSSNSASTKTNDNTKSATEAAVSENPNSCGQDAVKGSLKYIYSDKSGCSTGCHVFSTESTAKEELCAALKDDKLNQQCAGEIRAQQVKDNCTDISTVPATEAIVPAADVAVAPENAASQSGMRDVSKAREANLVRAVLPATPPFTIQRFDDAASAAASKN